MARTTGNNKRYRSTTAKVTSIGGHAKPTNKSKRRSYKAYRGQGR